jgi:hypothetical protein
MRIVYVNEKAEIMTIKIKFIIIGGLLSWGSLFAQPYLYFGGNQVGSTNVVLGYLNLATCEVCIEFIIPQNPGWGVVDVQALPNGQVLTLSVNNSSTLAEINIYQPPNSTPISTFPFTGLTGFSVTLSPTGTIYYYTLSVSGNSTESCLNEYDPVSNTSVVVGCADDVVLSDLFYSNGTLYSFGYTGLPPNNQNYGLFSVVVGDPLQVTLEENLPFVCGNGDTAVIPNEGIYTTSVDCTGEIFDYDLPNNSYTLQCNTLPQLYYGFSELPTGFPPPPATCACITEVGEISSMDTILCTNEVLNLNSTGSNLDSDDVIEYLLFSDLTDTLGSIIQTSTSPSFSFSDPPLSAGTTYYVVAIAGNELPSGGVDLTDICLDFSNVISVTWNPLSTVDFAVANPDVCEGECTEVEVMLTGTPQFSLTYDTLVNSGQIEIFTGSSGTLTICVPSGSPPGSFDLQAVSLTDANCVCE